MSNLIETAEVKRTDMDTKGVGPQENAELN